MKLFLLTLLLLPFYASAVSWTPPNQRTDNSDLDPSEIGGYKIYCGTSAGAYDLDNPVDITDGTATRHKLTFETAGERFCSIKTYDTGGRHSVFSNEISKDFIATIPVSDEPNIITNLQITHIDGLRYRFTYDLPTHYADGREIKEGDISILYPFEVFEDDSLGKWQGNVDPKSGSFELTLTEGAHFFNMEVEIKNKVTGALTVSKRSEIQVIDVRPDAPANIKAPVLLNFDDSDGIQP